MVAVVLDSAMPSIPHCPGDLLAYPEWTIPKSGVMSTTSPVPGLAYDGCGVVSSNDLVGVMDEHSVCEPVQPTYLRWPQLRETRLVELLFRQE